MDNEKNVWRNLEPDIGLNAPHVWIIGPVVDDGLCSLGPVFPTSKQNMCLSGVSSPMSLQGSNSVPVHNSSMSPSLPTVSPPSGFLNQMGTPSQFPPPATLAPFSSLPPFPPSSSSAVPTFVSPPPSAPMMSTPPAGPPMSTFPMSAGHDITKGHAGRTPQTPLIPTFSVPGPGEPEPPPAAGSLDLLHVAPDVSVVLLNQLHFLKSSQESKVHTPPGLVSYSQTTFLLHMFFKSRRRHFQIWYSDKIATMIKIESNLFIHFYVILLQQQ